jgi:hypothetical protein
MPENPQADLVAFAAGEHPKDEAMLADSIGVALLVLLDSLGPAERVAFVLHDMFDVPFEDIADIVGKTTEATRQPKRESATQPRAPAFAKPWHPARLASLIRRWIVLGIAFTGLANLLSHASVISRCSRRQGLSGEKWGYACVLFEPCIESYNYILERIRKQGLSPS